MSAAGKLARCLWCGEDYTIPATGPIVCPDCGPERPATRPALGGLALGFTLGALALAAATGLARWAGIEWETLAGWGFVAVCAVLVSLLAAVLWLVDVADATEDRS